MYKSIIALCAVFLSLSVCAGESADRPSLKPGDKWAYKFTTEKHPNIWTQKHNEITVVRSNQTGILIATKESGSTLAPSERLVDPDWSVFRNVGGKETIVSQPLKFPISAGKSWELQYTLEKPSEMYKNLQTHLTYSVVGDEEVEVPAGKFKAIKIEANGTWTAELAPSLKTSTNALVNESGTTVIAQSRKITPQTSTGRLYRMYWYVPSVKRIVKTVEESYGSAGTRQSRNTIELTSYNVAP